MTEKKYNEIDVAAAIGCFMDIFGNLDPDETAKTLLEHDKDKNRAKSKTYYNGVALGLSMGIATVSAIIDSIAETIFPDLDEVIENNREQLHKIVDYTLANGSHFRETEHSDNNGGRVHD